MPPGFALRISPLAKGEYRVAGRGLEEITNYSLTPPSCALVPLSIRGHYWEEEIK